MTWSIIVRETDAKGKTTRFGIAIASRFFSVGMMCPRIRAGAGAICSQALMNPTFPPRGLRLLAEGVPAPDVLRILLESDAGAHMRQVHLIDDAGRIAQHTGAGPKAWAGHMQAENVSVAGNIPAGFDVDGFLRQAKLNFVRLQAAHDAGNVEDIRNFTTPEVFAEIRLQMDERGGAAQQTDVVTLEAELLEVAEEFRQYVASVRFHGSIRESAGAAAEAFDEIWHLTKPVAGSGGWVIAGIQQAN